MTEPDRNGRLRALLRYFATLARPAREQRAGLLDGSKTMSEMVYMGDDLEWIDQPVSYIADFGADRLPALSKLSSIQSLHEGEQVLYAGWPWLSGTVPVDGEETRVCLPVLEAAVDVSPNRLGLGYRVRLVGPPEPTPLLADTSEELWDIFEAVAAPVSKRRGDGSAEERLAAALWDRLRDELEVLAHIPEVAVADNLPTRLRSHPGLHLVLGAALYVKSGVRPGSRSHELLAARDVRLAGTALDVVYNGAPGTGPVRERRVVETTSLTRPQHVATASALNRDLTVVAGPPGTGKTHAAVAAALAAVGHGDSVLIATTSRFAADVIAQRFRTVPGLRFFRFGSEERPALLEAKESDTPQPGGVQGGELYGAVAQDLRSEADLERALRTRRRAMAFGAVPRSDVDLSKVGKWVARADGHGWWATRVRRKAQKALAMPPDTSLEQLRQALEFQHAERLIETVIRTGGVSLDAVWADLEQAVDERHHRGRRWVASTSAPAAQSQVLATLDTALRAGPTARRRKLAAMKSAQITASLPLWIGTLTEISEYLPLAPAMFDLLIMDEASHTNQLDAIPALVRAQRAMILGDPRQLRHVSFVGDEHMTAAAGTAALGDDLALKADIRRNSAFDVASMAGPAVWLNEHHRSAPHIINFSAQRFYDGLIIMTRHPHNETLDLIHTEHVPDGAFDRGLNTAEANRVEDLIRRLDSGGPGSIGVVTPFRNQADLLEERMLNRFDDADIRRLRLRVGTVHGFQGNQRDTMIISTVVSPDNLSALRFVEDPNLFNVMVTRARLSVWLVTSVTADDLPRNGLLAEYLRHADEKPVELFTTSPDEGWTTEVFTALRGYDMRVVPEYPVGPYTIDLVIGEGPAAIGVETRVHDGGIGAHIERHLALRRAGWTLIDAFESRWMTRPEAAAQHIAEMAVRATRSL